MKSTTFPITIWIQKHDAIEITITVHIQVCVNLRNNVIQNVFLKTFLVFRIQHGYVCHIIICYSSGNM